MRDLEQAAAAFERILGRPPSPVEHIAAQGVRVCFFEVPGARIELLEADGPETPVGRFLARRGEGLHHVALRVAGLARVSASLEAAGLELTPPGPAHGGGSARFVKPSSAAGVLVELVEPPSAGAGEAREHSGAAQEG